MSTATPAAFGPPAERLDAPAEAAPAAARRSRGAWLRTFVTLLVGFLLGGLTAAAVGLWYMAESVPDFYTQALREQAAPAEREANAEAFVDRTAELARELEYAGAWEQRFTQAEINGWLAERLPEEYGDRIPDDVSAPRVDLSRAGRVRLGFRLSNRRFDGVICLAVRPEVVGPNRLALHVEGLMAGLFPLDPATFAPQVSKWLEKYRVPHEWDLAPAAAEGEFAPPILIVELKPRGAARGVLEEVEIDGGAVRVSGRRGPPVRLTRR